jgi:acyl-CoA reductase-like NAD-dependent aldehyde dehydrogenase
MWTDDQTTEFEAVDPRTGEAIGTFLAVGTAAVTAAAQAAAAAAADPRLRQDDARSALLQAAARGLRTAAPEVVAVAGRETGLPDPRLEGELERTARQLEAFAALVERGEYVDAYLDPADPTAKPIPRPDLRRMLVPIGPVAVFGAGNFPLAFSVAGGDTASALAAGCPVVVKGHPAHPGTGELVAEVLTSAVAEAGLPEGTFALLPAADATVGEALADRPEIAAIAFTGSFGAGTALFRRAAARPRPIPVFAEMSSSNPLIVTEGALRARGEEIAAGLATAIGGSAGQLCTKPGLVFVPAGEAGRELESKVASLLADQGEQVMLSEGICTALRRRTAELDGLAPVLEPLADDSASPGFHATARAYRTNVGSLIAVFVEYGDQEELLKALTALEGQLTGTLHLEPDEVERCRPLVEALAGIVGRLIFNGYPTGVAVTHAMHHGGPFPATTNAAHTSVGMTAIARFLRPLAWQDAPADLLPAQLRDENPRRIARRVDGELQTDTPAS